jgi:hypothetical protein
MYMQYTQGLCQFRLSTAGHAVFLVAPVYSLGTDHMGDTISVHSSVFSCFFFNNSSNVNLASFATETC